MKLRVISAAVAGALSALAVAVVVGAQNAAPAASGNDSLFAALEGKNEVGRGDKDGRGSFSGVFHGNKLCWGLAIKNVKQPAAAHIHKGGASANGDVVVTLAVPKSGEPGGIGGCGTVPAATRKDILKKPGGFYVNVHSAEFAGGAIRGQLFARTP